MDDLAALGLGEYFERAATNLAVGRKTLVFYAGVDDQIECLATKRALDRH